MKTKSMRKIFIMLMVIAILLPSLLINTVFATETETPPTPNSANEMSRSMIKFFREERTNLQVERVARDELMVYGVFLSNFFIPWSTTLGDMINETDENALPKKVSKKFFGTTEKSGEVAEVNKKLHDAIHSVLGFDNKNFAMYASKPSDSSKAMTGQDFYNKMAGVTDSKIYGVNGQELMDLSDSATQASLQVLFGISPEHMISEDKGLRKLTGLYMDGLGNIWGAHGNADVNDYVLVMPSAMNPAVFPKGSDGKFKFPVANVFAMGGTLKITSNFLSGKDFRTPYYNLKNYMPNTEYNNNNVITIFGVQSPFGYIGDTDSLIKNGTSTHPMGLVKEMLDEDTSSVVTVDKTSIVVSSDVSKVKGISDLVKKGNSLTAEQRENLVDYLFKTSVFRQDQIADDMYYFKVPMATSENASGDSEGSFGEVTDLIRKQKLFSKEVVEGSEYQFYNNSYISSPHNAFLKGYLDTSDKKGYLVKHLNKDKLDKESEEFNALVSFFEKGTWGIRDPKVINKAMELLKDKKPYVYNLVPPSAEISKIVTDTHLWGLMAAREKTTTFGLSKNDRYVTVMSVASNDSKSYKYDLKVYHPFEYNDKGGKITASGEKLTDKDVYTMSTLYHNSHTYRIFSMNSTFTNQLKGVASGEGKYKTPWGEGTLVNKTAIMNEVNNFPGIYWGYMVQMLQITPNEEGTGFNDPVPYDNPYLPYMEISTLGGGLDLNGAFGTAGVVASENKTLEEMQKDIVKKIYGILSDGPNDYRDKLIKSSQDSWIIATHRAITGSWIGSDFSVSAGGNSSYAAVVGYINTPSLTDLPLTQWVLQDYMYIYMLFLIIVMIVTVLMVITNVRTLREGLLIFLVMMFVLVLPQFLVSNVINISNKAGDQIYSGRFNYWAITQHQQTNSTSVGYRVNGDEMDYVISSSMESAKNVYSNDVGVRLKWMSPKKDDMFDRLFNKKTSSQSLMSNLTLFRWLFNSYMNQEEYVYNDPLATYLYRPYNSISQEAKESYKALSGDLVDRSDVVNSITTQTVLGMPSYRYSLYKNPDGKIKYTNEQKDLISSASIYQTSTDKEKIENYRYWSLANKEVTKAIFRSDFSSNAGYTQGAEDPYYQAYTLTTESPFYYFYNVLKHRYAEGDADFKTALLSKEVFKVRSTAPKVNGATRDFLDLEGLFTYVIPYMQQGNEYVYGWTNIYGKDIDGYDFEKGKAFRGETQDATTAEQDALIAKYQSEETKKANLKNVWKLYTPWVDQLYTLDVYSKKVAVGGKKVYVEDTLNPASYEDVGRPMIFSEADMYAKSYSYADLSDIERRIQATLDSTYKDLMYLTNYYDFEDEVLITAAAMTATFNFNREFSETRFLGESTNLYPQNFELKNFNYDAFMRLTLLNATGESIMVEKDLYARILDKTSIFTGMLLIVCDILAVIVIPTAKIAVLLLLLFLSILVSISCVITPPEKIFKTVLKVLGLPSLLFLVASTAFAFIISLFMGEGLTGYVGGRAPSLGATDPTTVLGLMAIVDCVYLFVLWRIVKMLLDGFKTHGTSTIFGAVSLVAGAGAGIYSTITDKVRGATDYGMKRRDHNEMLEAMRGNGASGGGLTGGEASVGGSSSFRDTNRNSEPQERDTEFADDIDRLASGNQNNTQNDNSVYNEDRAEVQSKSIGHKLIDFKHSMRNAPRRVTDSIHDTGTRIKDTADYVGSREGLRRDVVEGTREKVDSVRSNITNYRDDLRNYDNTKTRQEIERQESNKNRSPYASKRIEKDTERLKRTEQKLNASNQRNAIRDVRTDN